MDTAQRGKFIVFEGGEGAGKSTQVKLLAEELARQGLEVVATREPGGTPLGVAIRRLVLDPTAPNPEPRAELFLYAADRAQHVAEVVGPALNTGKWVISDRFTLSTIAYQLYGRNIQVAEDWVDPLKRALVVAAAGWVPDLTLVLEVPVEVGLMRAGRGGPDRMESMGEGFHETVRQAYRELAAGERNTYVIDADRPAAEVHAEVMKRVKPLL